jgi:hypothetical protein
MYYTLFNWAQKGAWRERAGGLFVLNVRLIRGRLEACVDDDDAEIKI